MKVDFMILGAQKCGTTSLFDILNAHPALVGCREKEPDFFSTPGPWAKGIEAYHRLYEQKEGVLYFEASTSYTFYPMRNLRIWKSLYEYNPRMKFIYLVRNPVDRIISGYMHSFERGYTEHPIQEEIIVDRHHLDLSRYYTQIIPYIRQFGRENVKIIDFADFTGKQDDVLREIASFLSIDSVHFSHAGAVRSNISIGGKKKHHRFDNPSLPLRAIRKLFPSLWDRLSDNSERTFSTKPDLSPELVEMIANMLELEIREMEKLMGKDLGQWMFPRR